MLELVRQTEGGMGEWPLDVRQIDHASAVALVLSQNQGVKLVRCKNANLCVKYTICRTSNGSLFTFPILLPDVHFKY